MKSDKRNNDLPSFTVVIPAHNESMVIERCLRAMMEGVPTGEIDLIVVCNGCTDDTAARARGVDPAVRVLELEEGSKPAALNAGDRAAHCSTRLFVDADVVIDQASVRAVARMLERGEALAAAPGLRVDLSGASRLVRMYYRIWTRLPYVRSGMVGSGVYGLSEQGRARFETFPDVIGDDAFIRSLFDDHERTSVMCDDVGQQVFFTVFPPRRLRELIAIEARRRAGAAAARCAMRRSSHGTARSQVRGAASLAPRVWLWLDLAVYVYVKTVCRLLYRVQKARGVHGRWTRDESSRSGPPSCTDGALDEQQQRETVSRSAT